MTKVSRKHGKRVYLDKSTNTWNEFMAICPYCDADLYHNKKLGQYNYVYVRRLYNTKYGDKEIIIPMCKNCADIMHQRYELVEVIPIKKGSDYSYEFATNSSLTAEERKKGRLAC